MVPRKRWIADSQRSGCERKRSPHQRQLHAVIQAAHPRSDEAHVVIERQPRYHHVVAAERRSFADGAHVDQQVAMGEDNAFGTAVLPDVYCTSASPSLSTGVGSIGGALASSTRTGLAMRLAMARRPGW